MEQLQVWWEAMQNDDLSVAFADSFPATLTDFSCEVARGEKLLLVGLVGDQMAAAMWLHDLVRCSNGTVSAGWVACYFLSPYRGGLAKQLGQAAIQHWRSIGIVHIFGAIHVANRSSQAFVTRGAYFHRVGRFPAFTVYHGQPTDLFIYTLHAEDAALAWELATARAARQVLSAAF
jgi:hypothetical protein